MEEPIIVPETEPLAPPPATIETEQEIETEEAEAPQDLDSPEPEDDALAPSEDDDEYELDGKKFRAPKSLKDRMLQHADYTKKTQDLSARSKELDAREAAMPKLAEDELGIRVKLAGVKEQLDAYRKLSQADWDAHYETDYLQTDKHWRAFNALKEQEAALNTELTTKQTERSQVAERDLANRVEETNKFAATNIKGYTPELTGKLIEFAESRGIDESIIKSLWSPKMYQILHEASIGAQVLKQQATPRAPKAATPPPAPLQIVRPAAPTVPSRSLAELAKSDDATAYIEARKAGRVR